MHCDRRFSLPYCNPLRHCGTIIPAMTKEEIDRLAVAFNSNLSRTYPNIIHHRIPVATIATVIDYLRGEIDGVETRLSDTMGSERPPSSPFATPPPADSSEEPFPYLKETLETLGSLGLQSLDEIKGYKYDSSGNYLISANGRFADTGWDRLDPHILALGHIMDVSGNPFEEIS